MQPEVIALRPDNPRSWALMPYVLERIKAFCAAEQPDEVPENLAWRVSSAFVSADSCYGIIVGLQDGVIVGHALLTLEGHEEKRWLTVQQYQLDKGSGMTRETVKKYVEEIKKVARVLKAGELRARAKGEARIRAFRAYGFKPMATILFQEVGE